MRHTMALFVLMLLLATGSIAQQKAGWNWSGLPSRLRSIHAWLSAPSAETSCGLLAAEHFIVLSQRVVLGDQLLPAAGMPTRLQQAHPDLQMVHGFKEAD